MPNIRVRSRVVYPLVSTGVDTSQPDTALYTTLRRHYATFAAPTLSLTTTVGNVLRVTFLQWKDAGDAAGVPLMRWMRNHVAETPREELDAVRRMFRAAIQGPDLTPGEKAELESLAATLPVSSLAASLLDGPEEVTVSPLSLAALFARWGEVAPTIGLSLRGQGIESSNGSTAANIIRLFDSTPPEQHNQLAILLLSQWSATGLPPLTVASLGKLPTPLLNALLSLLRASFDDASSAEGKAVRAILPLEEVAILDNLRVPIIGDAEADAITDPEWGPAVDEIARRLARAGDGKPPARKLLLPWFRLLDRTSLRGVRDLLALPKTRRKPVVQSLSERQRVSVFLTFTLSPEERQEAGEPQIREGIVGPEDVTALLSLLDLKEYADVVAGMLEGIALEQTTQKHLTSRKLWNVFVQTAKAEDIWRMLLPYGPNQKERTYGDNGSWRETAVRLFADSELRQRLSARLSAALREAGSSVPERLKHVKRVFVELNPSRASNEVFVYAIHLMNAIGAEGRELIAHVIGGILTTRKLPSDFHEIYAGLVQARFPLEEILAMGTPPTGKILEILLTGYDEDEIRRLAPQFVAPTEEERIARTSPENRAVQPWMELAGVHTLEPETEARLRIVATVEPRIRRGLFDAAPVRFRDCLDASLPRDLLSRLTQGFDILRAYSVQTLMDGERAAAWEAAHDRYAGSACGVALELALTFGLDLLPTFYRFTLDAWKPMKGNGIAGEAEDFEDGESDDEDEDSGDVEDTPRVYPTPGTVFDELYHSWDLPKKAGGKRTITAPERSLRYVQRRMLFGGFNRLLTLEHIGDAPHGFVPGRNIVSNALPHVGHELVVNVDINSFFPSIKYPLILKAVAQLNDLEGISLSPAAQRVIADLCSHKGVVPTGAPTSPAIANLVLRRVDRSIATLCAEKGVTYTRYADDLTFSGDSEARTLIPFVVKCLAELGLELDAKKTNLFRRGRRQIVTGLVVNEKPNIPRRLRRRLRAAVHQRSHGDTPTWHNRPMTDEELTGRLAFLKLVQPEEAARHRERLRGEE